jgi:hypothetical protein
MLVDVKSTRSVLQPNTGYMAGQVYEYVDSVPPGTVLIRRAITLPTRIGINEGDSSVSYSHIYPKEISRC